MKAIATATTGVAIFVFSFGAAVGYSINGNTGNATNGNSTTTAGSTATNALFAPFENFVRSIGSIGASDTVILPNNGHFDPPTIPKGVSIFTDIANAARQFDDWTYRTTGLRISALFVELLHIFSWFFGIMKAGVDWVLQWVH